MQRGMLQPGAKTEGCRRERQNSRRLHMGQSLRTKDERDQQAFLLAIKRANLSHILVLFASIKRVKG